MPREKEQPTPLIKHLLEMDRQIFISEEDTMNLRILNDRFETAMLVGFSAYSYLTHGATDLPDGYRLDKLTRSFVPVNLHFNGGRA